MSTKIGRFEILGELARSESSCVYKASDPESGQTLALKTYKLEAFGEHAGYLSLGDGGTRAPQFAPTVSQHLRRTNGILGHLVDVFGPQELTKPGSQVS